MTTVTPETLPRHELVGLQARVAAASNPDLVDIEGEVVLETTKTLGIQGADRVAHVPKEGTTFEFDLGEAGDASNGSEEHGDSRAEVVTVEGGRLVARPARRTENTGDSTWR